MALNLQAIIKLLSQPLVASLACISHLALTATYIN